MLPIDIRHRKNNCKLNNKHYMNILKPNTLKHSGEHILTNSNPQPLEAGIYSKKDLKGF